MFLSPIQSTGKTVNKYSLTILGNIPYAHSQLQEKQEQHHQIHPTKMAPSSKSTF